MSFRRPAAPPVGGRPPDEGRRLRGVLSAGMRAAPGATGAGLPATNKTTPINLSLTSIKMSRGFDLTIYASEINNVEVPGDEDDFEIFGEVHTYDEQMGKTLNTSNTRAVWSTNSGKSYLTLDSNVPHRTGSRRVNYVCNTPKDEVFKMLTQAQEYLQAPLGGSAVEAKNEY